MNNLQLIQLLGNAAMNASFIFVPLLAADLGISYAELGIIGSSFYVGSLISYFLFGRLSDEWGEKTRLIQAGLLVSSAFFYAQLLINDFASFTIIRFLTGFAIGIFTYPLVGLAAAHPDYKKQIGFLSAYGALGWFAGSFIAVFFTDVKALFAISGTLFLAGFAASLRIRNGRASKTYVPLFPVRILKKNFSLYFAYFLRHLGANAVWIIQPIYLAQLGADKFWIAAILALNPLAQFFLMRKVGEYAQKGMIDEQKLIRAGALASAAVFAVYAFIPHFYFAFGVALLIAVSWSFLYVGSMVYLTARNTEKATSTSLLGSFLSLSSVIGLFVGGVVSDAFGIHATFALAFALCCASLLISEKL